MTARSIRRAQERKARKEMQRAAKTAALQAEKHLAPQAAEPVLAVEPATSHAPARRPLRPVLSESLCWNNEPLDDSPTQQTKEARLFTPAPLSPAQLAANRANSQLSPGPTSPEGKAKSSLNAVKTALTGRTVLLPSDDAPAYERHLRAYADDLRPLGARECDLLQSIADTAWRLKRIPCLETAIFAQGYIEFGEAFHDHDPSLRASMIEVQTFFKYEKQLRNLQLQESRLARRREKRWLNSANYNKSADSGKSSRVKRRKSNKAPNRAPKRLRMASFFQPLKSKNIRSVSRLATCLSQPHWKAKTRFGKLRRPPHRLRRSACAIIPERPALHRTRSVFLQTQACRKGGGGFPQESR